MRRRERQHREYLQSRPVRKPQVWRLLIFPFVLLVMVWFVYNLSNITGFQKASGAYLFTRSHLPLESQKDFDVSHYDLDLQFDFPPDSARPFLKGAVTIQFTSQVEELKEIQLDFNTTLRVDSITGNVYRFQFKDGIITISLRHPLARGQQGAVTVFYQGYPALYHPWVKGMAFTWRRRNDYTPVPWVNTMNPPFAAQTWFPCKDVPADKADSATIRITVPDTLVAVSNGVLVATHSRNGRKQFIWKTRYAIAPYLIAVNIGDYQAYRFNYTSISGESFPIVFYHFNEDAEVLQEVQRQMHRMMRFFETHLGPYPFREEKYGMIVYDNSGGMENQTISSIQTFAPARERLFAHELAHQWVGNWVTNATFHQSFLNEGMATYLTALYWRSVKGDSAFKAYMERMRVDNVGPILVEHILVPDSVYSTDRVYFKGAWFFRMLHEIVGEEKFWQALQTLLNRHAGGTMTYTDLLAALPELPTLPPFFESWLHQSGVPHLEIELRKLKENGRFWRYRLQVRQTNRSPFVLMLPVVFYTNGTRLEKDFWIDGKRESFQVDFNNPLDSVRVDYPGRWLISAPMSLALP